MQKDPKSSQNEVKPMSNQLHGPSTSGGAQLKARSEVKVKEESPSTSFSKPESDVEKKIDIPDDIAAFFPVVPVKGQMATKLKNAAPYNIFLTTITANEETHNEPLSVTFPELLDDSLGDLESSVQINFMIDMNWLYANYYYTGKEHLPLLLLYGDEDPELETISSKIPNITAIKVEMKTPYGCHHTKIMLFSYKDNSMRIVVSTANLYDKDWHNRVQALWISDSLPRMKDQSNRMKGESITGFREDFLKYLRTYNIRNLDPWISRIRKTDFSKVNVFFVASSPGIRGPDPRQGYPFGHPRLAHLLGQHSAKIPENCPIIAQCSSIGNYGPNPNSYLLSEIVVSFWRDSAPARLDEGPQLKLIYPSYSNVKDSYDGMIGGGCLPYGEEVHLKQIWLQAYLQQWKSDSRNRTRAMPHTKCYGRYSDEEGLYWFCLTSANFSKSAWGTYNRRSKLNSKLWINNYEAGVVFFPQVMIDQKCFPLKESQQKNNAPIFQLPFDLPTTPYTNEDTPFCMDYLREFLESCNE